VAVPAIDGDPFLLAPLIPQPQAQLEDVLGAAAEFVTADRPNTETRGGEHRRWLAGQD
jgi:hypothetical protein